MVAPMRRPALLLAAAALLSSCAAPEQATKPVARAEADGTLLVPGGLSTLRCLVLAPFENTTELPELGEVATGALVHTLDPVLIQLFPIQDLRNLFARTPLALPDGVSPSLALALGKQVGSDAVLYGSVEGRVKDAGADFLVTLRLQSVTGRDLLFARTAPVRAAPEESVEVALRRTLVNAARPMVDLLGGPRERKCFDADLLERAASLRDAAAREEAARLASCPKAPPCPEAKPCPKAEPCPTPRPCPDPEVCVQGPICECIPCPPERTCPPERPCPAPKTPKCPEPPPAKPCAACPQPKACPICPPPPAPPKAPTCPEPPAAKPCPACPPAPRCPDAAPRPPPKASAPAPVDPRVTELKAHLRGRTAFLLDDVVFAGRSPVLVVDDGLERLAAAMKAVPKATVMLEVYVDATEDARRDFRASMEMAVAATRRLEALGVSVERVAPVARGGTWPIAPNDSSRGRAANRRIEIVPFR